MGLAINKTLRNGLEVTYLRIKEVWINYDRQISNTTIALYKDQDTRTADVSAVGEEMTFTWGNPDFPFDNASADPRTVAYDKLKTVQTDPIYIEDEKGDNILVKPAELIFVSAKDVFEEK